MDVQKEGRNIKGGEIKVQSKIGGERFDTWRW